MSAAATSCPRRQEGGDCVPGADFALDYRFGQYKFAAVFPGDNTREKYRSPLTPPGVDLPRGEYLLAVDGQELKAPVDPYSLLAGKQTPR